MNLRPVLPIAVRIPGFFETVNPLWPPYLSKDCRRIAEMAGQPYRWPKPDPIVQDREQGRFGPNSLTFIASPGLALLQPKAARDLTMLPPSPA